MQGADTIIVAIIVVSVIVGTVRGFIREVVALVTWLVAIWVAWRFSGFLHPYLGGVLSSPEQKAWVARGIMLIAVLMAGALIGHVLSWITHSAAGLSTMDRVLGFVFGLTRGVVVVGFAVLLGESLRLEHEPWWQHSKLMTYSEYVASWLRGFTGESREFAHRALDAALERSPRGEG
jgi:membrane protein required for colicin V production